jgi:2,3-bisphosphoglycerate-independent phosphoglycerate mutase
MGVPIAAGEVVFRANLVALKAGSMWSYCAGQITGEEASQIIDDLNKHLGSEEVSFHTGVGYRHLLKIKGHTETARALCTPPHDISGKPIRDYLPHGRGSRYLRRLMANSERILADHPVNLNRIARGQIPATTLWLFWGSGRIPAVPPFEQVYGLKAAITSGVDLLRGLGQMMGMSVLNIHGVTDNLQNDFTAQVEGGLAALKTHDLTVIHVEAPDEAGHAGSVEEKVTAIEKIDELVISRLAAYTAEPLRLLIMPDHPTPVACRTHVNEPVPFLFSGAGFAPNGARRFSEKEASATNLVVPRGFDIMQLFTGGDSHVQA